MQISNNDIYLLGFWYAKGIDKERLCITVNKKDKYLMKQLAKELNYENSLLDKTNKQICKIEINNVPIRFKKLLLNNKIPKIYLPDFIRGYFDGCGQVQNLKGNRINIVFPIHNKIILEFLEEFKGSYDKEKNLVKFGNKDSYKIAQYMYKNNPELFLLRKRNKFINLS